MQTIRKLSMVGLLPLFCILVSAQVTIGSDKAPVHGALLQLKQNDNVDEANSVLGMMLPRLQLTAHNLDSIDTAPSDTPNMYTGLTVWNVRGVGDICKGVQVWDGERWVSPMPKPKDHTNYNSSTGILTDHEGNSYPTAEFGKAGRWMTVNLRTTRAPGSCEDSRFPSEIDKVEFLSDMSMRIINYPNGSVTSTDPPSTWTEEQGLLYSWALATNGKGGSTGEGNVDDPTGNADERPNQPVQRQGICPDGWHLPSYQEWVELFQVLEDDAISTATDKYGNYNSAQQPNPIGIRGGGTSAKSNERVTDGTIDTNGASKKVADGGFSALFTGQTSYDPELYGQNARFWTASAAGVPYNRFSVAAILKPTSSTFGTSSGLIADFFTLPLRSHQSSVRCKKNEN